MSNMQLREEQLKLSEEHDKFISENYQLQIENEDLRDRLGLLENDCKIEYQAYVPVLDFEKIVNKCNRINEIQPLKSLILTYIFSLKKENRNLHRRLNDKINNNYQNMKNYTKPKEMKDSFVEFKDMKNKVLASSSEVNEADMVEFEDLRQQVHKQLNKTDQRYA